MKVNFCPACMDITIINIFCILPGNATRTRIVLAIILLTLLSAPGILLRLNRIVLIVLVKRKPQDGWKQKCIPLYANFLHNLCTVNNNLLNKTHANERIKFEWSLMLQKRSHTSIHDTNTLLFICRVLVGYGYNIVVSDYPSEAKTITARPGRK